jgi:uncharacterized membrane protein
MTCKESLAIILGAIDASPSEARRARLHAGQCARCGSAYDPADDAHGSTGHSPETATVLRVGLVTIALAQLVFAIPWVVGHSMLPDAHVAVSHLTRDGALGLVIAALGLLTAWRPRYAHSTMIIGLCVFATQVVAGLADQQTSSVSASFEIVHLLLVIIVFGMFVVAADVARRATPSLEPRSPIVHSRSLLS